MTPPRRSYIDWLRGAGVLVMIEAHLLDAWTAPASRSGPIYGNAMVLGGFAAPIFLFLAGLSLTLSIGARLSKGASGADAAAAARRRGWQILGLAFLFRVQSWILSGGTATLASMLKVDILNIMGLAMVATVLLWSAGRHRRGRVIALLGAAAAAAMMTPLVRATPLLDVLPDALESYLRPLHGRGTFALFPWAGFLFAGAGVGLLLDAARTAAAERRAIIWCAVIGPLIAVGGYGASFLPAIYAETSYWTSSPTFFFVRLGLLVFSVALAYAWDRRRRPWPAQAAQAVQAAQDARWSPLVDLGKASLFVYWVHVELAYGLFSRPLHKRFDLGEMMVVYVLFVVLMLGLTRIKQELSKPLRTQRLLSREWRSAGAEAGKQAKYRLRFSPPKN